MVLKKLELKISKKMDNLKRRNGIRKNNIYKRTCQFIFFRSRHGRSGYLRIGKNSHYNIRHRGRLGKKCRELRNFNISKGVIKNRRRSDERKGKEKKANIRVYRVCKLRDTS